MRAGLAATFLWLAAAGGVQAFDLSLPGNARQTAAATSSPDSHALAIGPFADGALAVQNVEGRVDRSAWRLDSQGVTTLQLLSPLRDQLASAGFETIFECEAAACGGFDFRYALEIFPEPAMHVDLFDYRYLAARRRGEDGKTDYVAVLVSRSASAGFTQIVTISPPGSNGPTTMAQGAPVRPLSVAGSEAAATPLSGTPLDRQLQEHGHAVLSDLTFETGSSALGNDEFASLSELAAFLLADPTRRVALVGHTDAVGSLQGNIALSKRRAASVLERLVSAHGVPRGQLAAEGMGYLAPITTNLTAEGRERNRRVEAILLNTE